MDFLIIIEKLKLENRNEEAKEYPKMIFEDQISKIEEALAERGLMFR